MLICDMSSKCSCVRIGNCVPGGKTSGGRKGGRRSPCLVEVGSNGACMLMGMRNADSVCGGGPTGAGPCKFGGGKGGNGGASALAATSVLFVAATVTPPSIPFPPFAKWRPASSSSPSEASSPESIQAKRLFLLLPPSTSSSSIYFSSSSWSEFTEQALDSSTQRSESDFCTFGILMSSPPSSSSPSSPRLPSPPSPPVSPGSAQPVAPSLSDESSRSSSAFSCSSCHFRFPARAVCRIALRPSISLLGPHCCS
mmetsp:Transcript_115300/g.229775  ORF Transcript_115300/g.229775 Transcript_115300/m.229775 type:complete len:254 (-) Transcript_115300:145-906(-)